MALGQNLINEMNSRGRELFVAENDDPRLGPLRWLPGKWENTTELIGHGFNIIALPFGGPNSENGYRLLINQYSESLIFLLADIGVPNRGVDPATGNQTDQTA